MESNPGPGAWSFVAYNGRTRLFGSYSRFEKETSNRAKMMAVLGALRALKMLDKDWIEFTFHTNYKVLADAIELGWIEKWKKNKWKNSSGKAIDNQDLWEQLDSYISKGGLDVVWSKKQEFRYKLPRRASGDVNRRCSPSQKVQEQQ